MGTEFRITADNDGRRVDRVLRTKWPDVPLGAIMKAVRTGAVRLDGRKTKPDERLSSGQILNVPWEVNEPTASGEKRRVFTGLDTLYRDGFVWIVNKPAGLLVQPDKKGGDSVITRALSELGWTRSDFRPAPVQRLDRNTTGAVMIALTGAAQRLLSELIRERKIKKIYHAVVEGSADDEGRVDIPLKKDTAENRVRADKDGQEALTLYRCLADFGTKSLVELQLITGRPHQARVHMAYIGHPIVGDAKYGSGRGARRPLLHARRLIFPDCGGLPAELCGLAVTAPLPDDMKKYETEDK
ncbi:MAG: RluA family pseudouridine synthase [Synergistes sp.]|nr:RluA family pseudouridine synthase [Synergistes sp.]MCR5335998.1 RluA family pseudouridine synthase [Synergistes sp.]